MNHGYNIDTIEKENSECYVNSYPANGEGVFLVNPKKDCRVLKKFDGTEIDLPAYLDSYSPYDNRIYLYPDYPHKNIIWMKPGEDDNTETNFAIAIMNYEGGIVSNLETDIPVKMIDNYFFDINHSRILCVYSNNTRQRGLLILSFDSQLIKHYPNYDPGNFIRFDPKAPDYAITRESTYISHIINLRNGEIVAEIAGRKIDLCQVDSTLIALVNRNPTISLIDVLSGKLIQDFSDYTRKYEVTFVRISPNGKEIWYGEEYSDKSTSIKHYHLED